MPHADYGFHVKVGGEKDDDTVGGDLREFLEETAVVTYDAWFITNLEARGYGRLVRAAGYDHGQKGTAGQGHAVGFLDNGCEAQHFGIHFERGYCTGSNDNRAEAVEDGFDGNSGI